MPHWIIYGMTDSGKSYYVKQEFIKDEDITDFKQIIIIDCTGEYSKYKDNDNIKYYFVDNSDPDEFLYTKLDRMILSKNHKKMVIIDECHLISENNKPLFKHIIKWCTTARKHNSEMVILTQRPQLIHSKTPHSQSYYKLYFAMETSDIESLRQSRFITQEAMDRIDALDVDEHNFIIQEKKEFNGPYRL